MTPPPLFIRVKLCLPPLTNHSLMAQCNKFPANFYNVIMNVNRYMANTLDMNPEFIGFLNLEMILNVELQELLFGT